MSKKKVLHLYKDFYPPVVGGIEKIMNLMVTELAVDGEFIPEVLACNQGALKTCDRIYEGVSVTEAGEWFRFQSAAFSPAYVLSLRKKKVDLIHCHFPNPTSEIAWLISACKKVPMVVTYHSDIVRQKTALKFYRPVMNAFLKRAACIMPTSQNYLDSSEVLRQYASKCEVVPLGMDPDQLVLNPSRQSRVAATRQQYGSKILLFVGVLRYYKGLFVLLKAMQQTADDTRLLIVGKGPVYQELADKICEYGLQERVFLIGAVPDDDLSVYYHSCDALVLPSIYRSEAYGLCQIEAQLCGKPVISTRLNTGVPFINQDLVTGLTVPPDNSEQLAHAINSIFHDDDLRMKYGHAAKMRAEKLFTKKTMVEKMKKVYRRVLSES